MWKRVKERMAASERSKTIKKRTLPAILILCSALIILGTGLSAVHILQSYQKLDQELKLERTVYVNEISSQISTSVYHQRDWLLEQVTSSASALDFADVSSFDDLQRLYKDKLTSDSILILCSDQGKCFDVYGKPFPIQNNQRLAKVLKADTAEYFFEKSATGTDYWVFASPIEPRNIDGDRFVAVFEIYNVEQFQSVLSLDLFDDEGIALIINRDGTVNLSPDAGSLELGYNVIHTLQELGMSDGDASTIKTELLQYKDNRLYVNFANNSWLIDYNNIQGTDEFVLVMVPIAVTSAGVIQSLRATMLGVGGTITGIAALVLLFILRSVHLAKKRNKELYNLQLRSKVVESKNDFLAKMSHDIRTPLNAIIGMNYIATTQVEEDSPAKESLSKIDSAAKYLLSILNDILDMSKIECGKMEIHQTVFCMDEMLSSIHSIIDIQASEKGVAFELKADQSIKPYYIGDDLRINQILMNLVSNALKFTSSGGHIGIKIEIAEKDEDKETLRFIVSDDGIGMSEEFLQHIFDPFTQDGSEIGHVYGGSGLGLAIVKNLTEQMDGQIDVSSVKDKGSTFTVVLPLKVSHQAPESMLENAELRDETTLEGMRILLAEDNEMNRIIATEILQMFQVEVEEAVDGKAALENFLDKPSGYYTAIITDIRMPVMDGYEMADQIRHSPHPDGASIPIFAMSANAFDDDVAAAVSHGMNDYLKKPIDVDELKRTLYKYRNTGKEGEI